jgi:hypothetical protein
MPDPNPVPFAHALPDDVAVFRRERIDGETVRVPQDATRETFIAGHRERRAAARDVAAKVNAELADFAAADELTRLDRWSPDRRAVLGNMLRQRSAGSPI